MESWIKFLAYRLSIIAYRLTYYIRVDSNVVVHFCPIYCKVARTIDLLPRRFNSAHVKCDV